MHFSKNFCVWPCEILKNEWKNTTVCVSFVYYITILENAAVNNSMSVLHFQIGHTPRATTKKLLTTTEMIIHPMLPFPKWSHILCYHNINEHTLCVTTSKTLRMLWSIVVLCHHLYFAKRHIHVKLDSDNRNGAKYQILNYLIILKSFNILFTVLLANI